MASTTYDYETPANAMDSSITMTTGGGPKVLPPRTDRLSPVRAPSGRRTTSRGLKENSGKSRSASRSGKTTGSGQTRVKLGLASPFQSQPGSAPESPKKTTSTSGKKQRTFSSASEDLEVAASADASHRRRLSGPSTSLFVNVPDEHWLRPARILGSGPFTADYVPTETPVPFDLPDWSIDSATFANPGPLRMSTPPLRRRIPQEGALSAPNSPSDEEDIDMTDDNAKTPGLPLRRPRMRNRSSSSHSGDSIMDYDSIMDSTLDAASAKSISRRSGVRRENGRSSLDLVVPRDSLELDDVNRPMTAPSSPENARILPEELTNRSSQPSRTRSLDVNAEQANSSRPRARTIRASDYPQRTTSLDAAAEISTSSSATLAVPLSKTTRTRSGTIRPVPALQPDPPIMLPNLPPAAVLKPSMKTSRRSAMDAHPSPSEQSMATNVTGTSNIPTLLVPARQAVRRPMPSFRRARAREISQDDLGAYDASSDSLNIDQHVWNSDNR
ncbi:unnamed protein product [Peniophora sp. CBMAI 1063]|nr:unnamed protein product [Peniophora sp. CBMAI 1063]